MGDGVQEGPGRDPQAQGPVVGLGACRAQPLRLRSRRAGPDPRPILLTLVAVLALQPGCKPDEDEDGEEETPTAEAAGEGEDETPTPGRADGQPLTVDLQLENLSPLYKGFFSHEPFLRDLARTLSPHVQSRSVTVKVVWSEAEQLGSIQALIPDGEATLARVGEGLEGDGTLDPAPLGPYVEALDGYRRAVGEAYDLRVLSFAAALELWDPHSESRCLWTLVGGDAEPAAPGPVIACTDPFTKRYEIERDGEAWPAPVKASRKARKILLGALGR